MPETPATVLVVDDDLSVRHAMARLMRAAGLHVETFASAEEFLRRDEDTFEGPHCLLLDVHLPGVDGAELHSRLRETRSNLPVVFLTGRGELPMGVAAMKRGAVDFLTKPVDDTVLLAAIHAALDRHREHLELEAATSEVLALVERLSPREFEVMRCLISGARNKPIATRLGIVEQTVKVHRRRILSKLNIGSIAELVRLCALAGVEPRDDCKQTSSATNGD